MAEKKTWLDYSDCAVKAFEECNWKSAIENCEKALQLCPDSKVQEILERLEQYKQASKNKICIYTICRNESKYVDSWCEAHKTADKMVAVVHDCTDDTEEKLKSHGVIIEHDSIPNWRFDVGKNSAINAARKHAEDCNILIYASLDERFEPGWDIEFRKNWKSDTDQASYCFIQSLGPNGEERLPTYFVWATSNSPEWYFKWPVHEGLFRHDNKTPNTINLFHSVKLIHHQCAGGRNYQNLCDLRYKEYPEALSALYLSREMCAFGRYDEAIEVIKKHPIKDDSVSYEDLAYLYRIMGDCYMGLKKFPEAASAYDQARMICPEYSDSYLGMGKAYCEMENYKEAENILKQGLIKSRRLYSWIENPSSFEVERYSWLTKALFNNGKKIEALTVAAKCLNENPLDDLAKSNFKICCDCISDSELVNYG